MLDTVPQTDPYRAFLAAKAAVAPVAGFAVEPGDISAILKPHQRDMVIWACRLGRAALFASFGLGKSLVQLEILRQVHQRFGGDVPVVKDKPLCDDHGSPAPFDDERNWKRPIPNTGYSRARWQLDAHGYARSSGDRLISPAELAGLLGGRVKRDELHKHLYRLWRDRLAGQVYDFAEHVAISEEIDHAQLLPSTFMLLPPHSEHPDVWTDITRMRTLNGLQFAKGRELHLCPLQFDIVDRLIGQFSMPGETVFDPFGGLMTVPYCAVKLGRRGIGVELGADHWRDGVSHLRAAEAEASVPTLFDLLDMPAAAE